MEDGTPRVARVTDSRTLFDEDEEFARLERSLHGLSVAHLLVQWIYIPGFYIWFLWNAISRGPEGIASGMDSGTWLTVPGGLLLLVALLLAPFKRMRLLSGHLILITTWLWGASLALLGAVLCWGMGGLPGLLVGLILFGVGVVPVALVLSILQGNWGVFSFLALNALVLFGVRWLGTWCTTSSLKAFVGRAARYDEHLAATRLAESEAAAAPDESHLVSAPSRFEAERSDELPAPTLEDLWQPANGPHPGTTALEEYPTEPATFPTDRAIGAQTTSPRERPVEAEITPDPVSAVEPDRGGRSGRGTWLWLPLIVLLLALGSMDTSLPIFRGLGRLYAGLFGAMSLFVVLDVGIAMCMREGVSNITIGLGPWFAQARLGRRDLVLRLIPIGAQAGREHELSLWESSRGVITRFVALAILQFAVSVLIGLVLLGPGASGQFLAAVPANAYRVLAGPVADLISLGRSLSDVTMPHMLGYSILTFLLFAPFAWLSKWQMLAFVVFNRRPREMTDRAAAASMMLICLLCLWVAGRGMAAAFLWASGWAT